MAEEVRAFDVLKEMSRRDMKSLKGFGLGNIKSARVSVKQKCGFVEIAVDVPTALLVMAQKPIRFMLIVADNEDFERVEKELKGMLPPVKIV